MNAKKQSNFQEIEMLLDSDDELPSSYNENPILPAYINDNRFNSIQFKWINNPEILNAVNNHQHLNSVPTTSNDIPDTVRSNGFFSETSYITKGFLSKQDLLCLKYIAGSVTDAIVPWFVDFLVRKDLQSRYVGKFKSCLVDNFPCYNDYLTNYNKNNKENLIKKKYKIVVKV